LEATGLKRPKDAGFSRGVWRQTPVPARRWLAGQEGGGKDGAAVTRHGRPFSLTGALN